MGIPGSRMTFYKSCFFEKMQCKNERHMNPGDISPCSISRIRLLECHLRIG